MRASAMEVPATAAEEGVCACAPHRKTGAAARLHPRHASGRPDQTPAGPATVRGSVRIINQDPCFIHRMPSHLAKTTRSEEHTSELQSQSNLVCRLLLEKKKTKV